MGGAISALSGTPNSNEVNTMLNVILREMFQRADLVDLYSLADPDKCSKYLVVAADAMKQLFKRINLEPRIGNSPSFLSGSSISMGLLLSVLWIRSCRNTMMIG